MPSSSGSQVNGNLEGECQADRELQDTLGLQWQLWEGYRGQEGRSCESLHKFMGKLVRTGKWSITQSSLGPESDSHPQFPALLESSCIVHDLSRVEAQVVYNLYPKSCGLGL